MQGFGRPKREVIDGEVEKSQGMELTQRKLGFRQRAEMGERDEEGKRKKEVIVSRSFLETSGRIAEPKQIIVVVSRSFYAFVFRLREERGLQNSYIWYYNLSYIIYIMFTHLDPLAPAYKRTTD